MAALPDALPAWVGICRFTAPSPNCLRASQPQHTCCPPLRGAHMRPIPAAVAPVRPAAAIGVRRSSSLPRQRMVPSLSQAQTCLYPTASRVMRPLSRVIPIRITITAFGESGAVARCRIRTHGTIPATRPAALGRRLSTLVGTRTIPQQHAIQVHRLKYTVPCGVMRMGAIPCAGMTVRPDAVTSSISSPSASSSRAAACRRRRTGACRGVLCIIVFRSLPHHVPISQMAQNDARPATMAGASPRAALGGQHAPCRASPERHAPTRRHMVVTASLTRRWDSLQPG